MTKTIVVCGYGSGISHAVAERFGREGFSVALVARNADKVKAAAAALSKQGLRAQGFACDLSDTSAVRALIAAVRGELPQITVLHWNAYSHAAGDLLSADLSELNDIFNLSVVNMIAAVRECLPDLQQAERPGVLVTGGALSNYNAQADERAAQWGAMGLAVAKAAQRKAAGLLHAKLKPLGIYVGEVTVSAIVKGTAADRGNGTLEAAAVGQRFWELYSERREAAVALG
jgi:NAD(P)-dependent dehydrogenase (short-subunit alcohol dehydrogenase family)